MNQLVTIEQSNAEVYRASTDAAELCKGIVVASAMEIQGRKYVKVEGWQAIAIAHGCTASARGVERVEGGVKAIGEIRRMSDGAVIAEAEGFVGEDEPTWYGGVVTSYGKTKTLPKRPDYAIRAMAQTRAISRAGRSAFAHVVVMMNAGLSTTPAEEVPDGGFEDRPMTNVTPPKDTGPTPDQLAINLLRGCDSDPGLFKEAWSKNFEGWRGVMSDDEYKRVQTVKAEIVAKFVREAEEAKAKEAAAARAKTGGGSTDPATLADGTPFDDEIPFIRKWSVL